MTIRNICLLIFLSASVAEPAFATVKKGKREVLIDNDKVELVRLTYPPGTESGMHTHIHPHRTVYFVKGGQLKLVPADTSKSAKNIRVKDGDVLYLPATTHNVINVGATQVIIIENEIKG